MPATSQRRGQVAQERKHGPTTHSCLLKFQNHIGSIHILHTKGTVSLFK